MSQSKDVAGRCLCGAVSFKAKVAAPHVGACHCSICRRWAAGPFLGLGTDGKSIQISGEDQLGVYRSSAWGERCFCKTCGSVLFWRSVDGTHVEMSAGALDDQTGLQMKRQIFIDEKPAFYDFANDTERLTGPEFVKLIMGG